MRRTDSRRDRRPRRSSCRWSTCTPSGRAAARSGGAIRAERCGSARARPAPNPGPPATAGVGPSPPSPTPTSLLGNLAADSTLAGGVALDADAARAAIGALAGALGLDELETAEGIVRVANQEMVRALRVVTVERGVDPRALRAAAVRRRRADARGGDRRRAGDRAHPLPASRRRALGPRPLRLGPPPRHDAHGDAERRRAQRRADRRRGRRAGRRRSSARSRQTRRTEAEVVYEMRYAGQAFELPDPGDRAPRPGRPDRALRAGARGALRAPRPRRRGRPRPHPPGDGRAGTTPATRAPPPRARWSEGNARSVRFDGEWIETRVLRGEPPAGVDDRGAGRLRAARGDLRRPAGLGPPRSTPTGTIHGE